MAVGRKLWSIHSAGSCSGHILTSHVNAFVAITSHPFCLACLRIRASRRRNTDLFHHLWQYLAGPVMRCECTSQSLAQVCLCRRVQTYHGLTGQIEVFGVWHCHFVDMWIEERETECVCMCVAVWPVALVEV
jgi:hypothetical protein